MSYMGAKSATGAYQAIIAAMCPHDLYIETHLGSGVILRTKPAAVRSIGIDIDPEAPALKTPIGATIVNGDCVSFLQNFDFTTAGRVLVYADPPYVLATRTGNKRYRFDYTDNDHRRLIACLKRLPPNVSVMISGYPSELYDELLAGWRTIEFQVMTRGGVRTEKLWMNFPHDAAFWASYAGRNRTDRQRIKRKAAKWREMFDALPPGERLALLAALLAPSADVDPDICTGSRVPATVDAGNCAGLADPVDAGNYSAGDIERSCVRLPSTTSN